MSDDRRMVKRTDYAAKGFSVADTIDWCMQRDLDPAEVRYSGGGHLYYESPETDEEQTKRVEWQKKQAESQERWEREMLERLMVKYDVMGNAHDA